jgi:hypothetical protein
MRWVKESFCCEAGFSRRCVFVMIEWQRGFRDVLWVFTLLAYDLHCSLFVASPAAASHGFLSTPLPPRTYLRLDPSLSSAFRMPRSFFCLVWAYLLVLCCFLFLICDQERKEGMWTHIVLCFFSASWSCVSVFVFPSCVRDYANFDAIFDGGLLSSFGLSFGVLCSLDAFFSQGGLLSSLGILAVWRRQCRHSSLGSFGGFFFLV